MRKNFIIFSIISVLVFNISNAQWVSSSFGIGGYANCRSLAKLGNNIFVGTIDNGVYISTDNGMNWSAIGLNNKRVNALITVGNNIFAGTLDSGVYISTNNGINWVQSALNNQDIRSFVTLGNDIYAGTGYTYGGVFVSTNNGITWAQTSLNNKYVTSLTTLGTNIFAGIFYPTTFTGSIYRSTNGGINWTETPYNNNPVWSLITLGSNIFAGTSYAPAQGGGCVYLSTNNGINWIQTALNNQAVGCFLIYGNVIFAGSGSDGGVFLSSNNGTSWVQKNQGFPYNIIYIYSMIISNDYIFACINYYTPIWRRSISNILGIKKISELVPLSYILYQNYPNPFNPSTNIKYQITNNSLVTLRVFDLLGREIETLVNEQQFPGTYSVNWNADNYPSGVYFYTFTAGEFKDTKKMILVK
jgi:hypothetical protein